MEIKSVHALAKEWFDKVNGNSYNSVRVDINNGEKFIFLPFGYGYGKFYEHRVLKELKKLGVKKTGALTKTCRDNDIYLNSYKIENCNKKDVKEWGINR